MTTGQLGGKRLEARQPAGVRDQHVARRHQCGHQVGEPEDDRIAQLLVMGDPPLQAAVVAGDDDGPQSGGRRDRPGRALQVADPPRSAHDQRRSLVAVRFPGGAAATAAPRGRSGRVGTGGRTARIPATQARPTPKLSSSSGCTHAGWGSKSVTSAQQGTRRRPVRRRRASTIDTTG